MKRLALVVLAFCLFSTVLFAQPPGSEAPGIWEQRIVSVGQVNRLYYLYLPENYELYLDRPLIVNLHGSIDTTQLDSSGQRPEVFMFGRQFTPQYLDTTRASMMWKVAEAEHVLVACPLSKGLPAWSPDDPTSNLQFIDAMLNDLEANYADYIDSDRIYCTGFSAGGGQTHRIGYYGSDRFAAIAPMYYPMNTSLYPLGPPAVGPRAILFVANRYDPTIDVPYTEPSDCTTVLQTAQKWKQWMSMDFNGSSVHTQPIDTVLQIRTRNYPGGGDSFCFMNFYTLFESDGPLMHSYPKFDQHGFQANVEVWNFLQWFYIPPGRSREVMSDYERVITPVPMSPTMMSTYPNPFNAMTTLSLTLPKATELRVAAFDVLGREVAELANGSYKAGQHNLTFDATNLAGGTYFVRASSDEWNDVQKVMLVK
jgi:poly(3-hydroxybutyrate) depolymerase